MKKQSMLDLNKFREQYQRDYSIGDLTPTICDLFGIPEPEACGAVAVAPVVDQAARVMGEKSVERIVLFCCDAMGEHQRDHFPEVFARIEKTAPFRIPSVSVMPSVTPVCYGTIFTGASPSVHGIQKYEKPVLEVDTLFDAVARAGKNTAIISSNTCSIDMIFRRRDVDYFSFRTDQQSFDCTLELIEKNQYDLIICYMGGYDTSQHKSGCFSPESTRQTEIAADRFEQLAAAMDQNYKNQNHVLVFVPDHGGHLVSENEGTHGFNIPEDMLVSHYYRLRPKA